MMSRTAQSLISAVLLIVFAIANLPGGPARAANNCLTAPNAAPLQGSHWYYRDERVTGRKCWYLGPKGQKTRHAAPQTTLPKTDNDNIASSQILPSVSGEQTSNQPAMSAFARQRDDAGKAVQAPYTIPSWVQWFDPPLIASTARDDSNVLAASVAADNHDREVRDEEPQQSVLAVPAAKQTHPESARRIAILFVVAGAVIGGFFVNVIVSFAVARRQRVRVDPGRIGWQVDTAEEFDRSPFQAPYPGSFARPNLLSSGRQDEMVWSLAAEVRQPTFVHPLERRAA
jgi:hypothetical protein